MARVFFAMPLVGYRSDEQWGDVCDRLTDTLRSILASPDGGIEIVISGHERPDIAEMRDPRVTFIESKFAKPAGPQEYTRDKARKQRSNWHHVREEGGGYVVLADADDLFSKRLVSFIRDLEDPNGYVVRRGYVFSLANYRLAPIPGAWSKSFDQICGSSSIIRVSPSDIAKPGDDFNSCFVGTLGAHNKIAENANAAHRPLADIDWPAVVYMLGERETVSVLVNRSAERQESLLKLIEKRSVEITPEIVLDFSLSAQFATGERSPPAER